MPVRTVIINVLLLVALVVGGCKKQQTSNNSGLTRAKLQLNWVPEPEFGGFYAARESGAFKKNSLDVDLVPGGASTPTLQMAAAGNVQFAVISGDELVIARSRGDDMVALFAVYQTCPQGIMTHAARGLKEIGDIFRNPGTLAIEQGLPYSKYLEKKYGFSKLTVVPYSGLNLELFLRDPNFAQQCFVTSEPIQARRAKADPQTFLLADAGYNPYTAVMVTRGDHLKKNAAAASAMIRACREGWEAYLKDPAPTNAVMQKLNPMMDAQTFEESAKAQAPLIQTEQTRTAGLGSMTSERWKTLIGQLIDLGTIEKDKAPSADQCFFKLEADQSTTRP